MGLFEATQILSDLGYPVFPFRDGSKALLNHPRKKNHRKTEHNTSTDCSVLASKKVFVLGLPEEGLRIPSLNKNLDSSRTSFTPSTRNCTEEKNHSLTDVYNLLRNHRAKGSIGNDQEDQGFTNAYPSSTEELDDGLARLWREQFDGGNIECIENTTWRWQKPLDRVEKQYNDGSTSYWAKPFGGIEKDHVEVSTLHCSGPFHKGEKQCVDGSALHWWKQSDRLDEHCSEESTLHRQAQFGRSEEEYIDGSASHLWKKVDGDETVCPKGSSIHRREQFSQSAREGIEESTSYYQEQFDKDEWQCIQASRSYYGEQFIRDEKKESLEASTSHYQELISIDEEKKCIGDCTWHGSCVPELPSFASPRSLHGFSPYCNDRSGSKSAFPQLQDAWSMLGSEEFSEIFLDKDDGITVTRLLGQDWSRGSKLCEKMGLNISRKTSSGHSLFKVSIPTEMMKSMPSILPDEHFPVPHATPYFHIYAQMVELNNVEHVDLCIDWLLQSNPSVISLACKHAGGFLQLIQLSVHDRCLIIKVSLPLAPLTPVVPLKLRDLLSDREIVKVGANIQKDALSIYYFLGATSNRCVRISQFVGTKKRKSVLDLCRELFHWDWHENKKVIYSDWGSRVISFEQMKHAVLEVWTTRLVWIGQTQLWHVQSPAFSLVEFPWILLDYFGRSVFSLELQTQSDEVMSVEVKGATVELHGGRLSLKQKNFRSRVMGQNALVELHFKDNRKPRRYVTVYREGNRVVLDDAETPAYARRIEDLEEEVGMVSKIVVDKSNEHDAQKQKLEECLYMLLCIPGACPRHILAALGCLQGNTAMEEAQSRRSVDLDAPCVQSCKMGLNRGQSDAWRYMLSSPLSAVVGPPGTGKTTVISAVTKAWLWLASSGETLVCAAQQNVAVRHMAETMAKERIPGLLMLVSADYYEGWHEDEYRAQKEMLVVSGSAQVTAESIEGWISRNGAQPPRVVLCTLGVIGNESFHASLMGARVSALIIDEGSQAGEGSLIPSLGALPHLQMLSVVGDPCQLPPYGRRRRIRSVFDLVSRSCEIRVLCEQYRMPYRIAQFVSAEFYGGGLQTDGSKMREDSERALVWVDVRGQAEIGASGIASLCNRQEADAILEWCRRAHKQCYNTGINNNNNRRSMLARGKVVVLTLYEAQRSLISGLLEEQGLGDEIGVYNADSFQGQEADIVLISLVVGARISSFAADRRRACVLLSRAKRELLLFGNLDAIASPSSPSHGRSSISSTVWAALAKYCKLHGWVIDRQDRRRNLGLLTV